MQVFEIVSARSINSKRQVHPHCFWIRRSSSPAVPQWRPIVRHPGSHSVALDVLPRFRYQDRRGWLTPPVGGGVK